MCVCVCGVCVFVCVCVCVTHGSSCVWRSTSLFFVIRILYRPCFHVILQYFYERPIFESLYCGCCEPAVVYWWMYA